MVCCDVIRLMSPVWSCHGCYHVFHLNCIKKWARSPASQAEGNLFSAGHSGFLFSSVAWEADPSVNVRVPFLAEQSSYKTTLPVNVKVPIYSSLPPL